MLQGIGSLDSALRDMMNPKNSAFFTQRMKSGVSPLTTGAGIQLLYGCPRIVVRGGLLKSGMTVLFRTINIHVVPVWRFLLDMDRAG